MSVAKKERNQDKDKPLPSNEDEGKQINENDQNRFARTNQALKWAKGGIADAKLYIYAKTGQIEESEDSTQVTEAFQKLDTYKEQIDVLLRNAENWTKSMLQTWNYQTGLIEALNESHTVMNTFHSNKSDSKTDKNEFAEIMKGISNELYVDQTESRKRYGHASKLLVVPLRNILSHEIMHACDMKDKYVNYKRQFDNCCTTITHIKSKIEEIKNPKSVESEQKKPSVKSSTFGKLKHGFNKLIASNPTVDELENKLTIARGALPQFIKAFETAKQQLLEAVNICEEKLNVEVVYYVLQFYTFVQKWKSGNTPGLNESVNIALEVNDGYSGDNEVNNEEKVSDSGEIECVVQALEAIEQSGKEIVKDLQIDSMIQNEMPDMDEVNLDEEVVVKEEIKIENEEIIMDSNLEIDGGYENDKENEEQSDHDLIEQIEISENHDVET